MEKNLWTKIAYRTFRKEIDEWSFSESAVTLTKPQYWNTLKSYVTLIILAVSKSEGHSNEQIYKIFKYANTLPSVTKDKLYLKGKKGRY